MTPERLDEIRERAEAEEWRWDHHDQTESDRADLLAHVDHLTAENARLRAGIEVRES